MKIWIGWRTTQGVPVLEDQPAVCKELVTICRFFLHKNEAQEKKANLIKAICTGVRPKGRLYIHGWTLQKKAEK